MGPLSRADTLFFDLFYTLNVPTHREPVNEYTRLGLTREAWTHYSEDPVLYRPRALGQVAEPRAIMEAIAANLPFPIDEKAKAEVLALRTERVRRCLVDVPQETLDTLRTLKAAGKRLCLVSNADAIDTLSWEDSPLKPLMDDAVFSWQVGCMKPDPAIYSLALRRMGAAPERTAFIGDGGSDELAGAAACGLWTVLTEEYDVKPPLSRALLQANANAIITRFSELIPLFL